jgi:hypothetical protein
MTESLHKELLARGFRYDNGNILSTLNNTIYSVEYFQHNIKQSEDSFKKDIVSCWDEISKLDNSFSYKGKADKDLMNIVVYMGNKIQRRISCGFYGKNKNKITSYVNKLFSYNSINYFNNSKCNIFIKNFNCILRCEISMLNLFIINILVSNLSRDIKKVSYSYNKGVEGPWSHLDLPMQERVFKWEDIDEETMGRQNDKQHQRRYLMGLEDYDSTDSFKEGFYYRDLNLEPFLFEDAAEESPYPYRSVLWSQP